MKKRTTKPADQSKQNPKQKSYDANSHRTITAPSQTQLKEISKLAGRLQIPNSQALNTSITQQQKAYFGQPFINKASGFFNTTLNLGSLRQQSSMADGDAYGSVHELAGRHSTNWLRGRTNPTNTSKRAGSNLHQTTLVTSDLHGIHQTANTLNLSMLSQEQPGSTYPGSRAASVKRPASSVFDSLRAHQLPISAQTVAEPSHDSKQGSSVEKPHLGLHNHFHKKFRHVSEPDEILFKEIHKQKNMLGSKVENGGLQQGNLTSGYLDTHNLKEQLALAKNSFIQSSPDHDLGSKWTAQPGRTPLKFEFSDRMTQNRHQKLPNENDSWAANQNSNTRQSSRSPGRDAASRSPKASILEHKFSKPQTQPEKLTLDLECHENMEIILPRPITHIEEADDDCED